MYSSSLLVFYKLDSWIIFKFFSLFVSEQKTFIPIAEFWGLNWNLQAVVIEKNLRVLSIFAETWISKTFMIKANYSLSICK